ncbi:iron ABC transporter permease [Eggerthellaceae bacterium zg-1084]|uniref:Iron ABC transporter permease n=1 Tax=Berryella wangjianweii TaxID=2734634 RepID=A0A6M8IWU5_9ACTN|nr:iron ABC transporter permease [Berryella wangjianweii]NPD30546.1 iron ABC transporter permease [Berryella wangjianweii]QKF07205.1 iron ABC transporter permease [Berryella wangjianweii]
MSQGYRRHTRRRVAVLCAAFVAACAALLLNLFVGASGLTPWELIVALVDPGSVSMRTRAIVWDMRLPMALMGALVGAALAVAGAVMQTMLDNPLASPYTLGVSAGASVGASLAMVMGASSLSLLGSFAIPSLAFVFALLCCGGIYLVGMRGRFSSTALVLAGIGMVFFFQAVQSTLQYIATEEALSGIVFWAFGSLAKASPLNVSILAAVLAVCFVLFMRDGWRLTALCLGDERAEGMGVRVGALRRRLFVLTSLLTATAVSFVGSIGFIGIVGPHVARMLIGQDQRFLLPLSALCGSTLLSVASAASKIILPGAVFPIGIITALVGVPFFFALLLGSGRGVRGAVRQES